MRLFIIALFFALFTLPATAAEHCLESVGSGVSIPAGTVLCGKAWTKADYLDQRDGDRGEAAITADDEPAPEPDSDDDKPGKGKKK